MFDQILKLIEKYDSIVIFGHFNPDGDCYGAQVGLKEVILANYPHKKVYITGTGVPRFFSLISPMDKVSDEVIANSLAILVDGNDLSRMEDNRIYKAKAWAKIDHHIDTGSFTEGPFVVDVLANSACDIIAGLVMDLHLKISPLGANALYLGILTDSARFQFVYDYVQTFERVKFLCEQGAEPTKLNTILNKTDERSLIAKGYIMSHYQKTKAGVIYIIYDKETLHSLGVSANEASNLINYLANIEGYPIWCSFAEYDDGKVRCEFRSNGPEVQPVAASIGGGGHAMASGCQLPKLDLEYIKTIIKKYDETLINWRKKQYVGKRTTSSY